MKILLNAKQIPAALNYVPLFRTIFEWKAIRPARLRDADRR